LGEIDAGSGASVFGADLQGGDYSICGCAGGSVAGDSGGWGECGGAGNGGRVAGANDFGAARTGMPPDGDSRGATEETARGRGSGGGSGAGTR